MKKAVTIIGAIMLAIVILSIALVMKLINIIIPSAESQPAVNTTYIEQVLSQSTDALNNRTLSIVLDDTTYMIKANWQYQSITPYLTRRVYFLHIL